MTKNIFKLVCSTLLALCIGTFTSCDQLGDGNPDFKFKEEYEVLMGKWTCETYLEGEPHTLQFTFHKNGKVNVREIFDGDDVSVEMLYNINGNIAEKAYVSIYGGPAEDMTFVVTVNGDEAIFIEDGEEMVFKREE